MTCGSFSPSCGTARSRPAAGVLAIDHSTVSRRLRALEAALGVPLLLRGRRGVHVTEDGARVLQLAQRAEEPMLALLRHTAGPEPGTVRVATSSILSRWLLAPHIADLARAQPHVALQLLVGRALVELSRREADIALRLRPPGHAIAERSAVAMRLAQVGFALCGTREQVRARSRSFVRYAGYEPARRQLETLAAGAPTIAAVDDVHAALGLARAGAGLAVLPCFVADAEPGLVRASEVLEMHGLYCVVLTELRKVPRIAAVVRWLRDVTRAHQDALAGG